MRQSLVISEADFQRLARQVLERSLTSEELTRVIAALTGSTRLEKLVSEAIAVIGEGA